jgi:diaminopimelate decarboxylase
MTDSLRALIRRHGTPLYVYRLDRVRRAARDLLAALPEASRLYYSVKANPHPALIAELSALGLYAELSSTGELAAILAAGHPASRCLYSGPGKTPGEIRTAIASGVRSFSVESVADRGRLVEAARDLGTDVDYVVRLNGGATAGAGLRMTGRPTQFGTDVDRGIELAQLFTPLGRARPKGAHIFSGTNVADSGQLLDEFRLAVGTIADALVSAPEACELIDLGGGFSAPFARPGERADYPDLRVGLEKELDSRLPGWRLGKPVIAFESGRYLVADCGTLHATVLDVKHSKGTTFVVLDAGVQTLGGMWGLGRLSTPSAQPLAGPGEPTTSPTLVGPLCTPLDVLGRHVALPPPKVGDVLEFPNVGAYGLSASLVGFLSRPLPVEAVLDADGEIVDVRRLELRPEKGLF